MEKIEYYLEVFKDKSTEEVLEIFVNDFKDNFAFATSFGAEDQVVADIITKIDPEFEIFTLDTGRLPEETYRVWQESEEYFGIKIIPYYPNQSSLQKLILSQGINGFYDSVEKRKECCRVRKIEPLKIALKEKKAWITGLRQEQSITRKEIQIIEYDSSFNILKLNPLYNWSTEEIWKYIKDNKIPYNRLHDSGYPSIGCEPCTRPVPKGSDLREGRWWWENPEHKECGLHIKQK